ncbi:MAG: hypothetical protein VKI83_05580 [Synechococcaceae cyanobacterium]|nr:hypothetical protein [Synechococcaceae cyanobacterium]
MPQDGLICWERIFGARQITEAYLLMARMPAEASPPPWRHESFLRLAASGTGHLLLAGVSAAALASLQLLDSARPGPASQSGSSRPDTDV